MSTPLAGGSSHGAAGGVHAGTSSSQPPLSSIAERRSDSGEDTEDEVAVEGGWKTADVRANRPRNSADESVIKAGYLWKKGERRKVHTNLLQLLDFPDFSKLYPIDVEETMVRPAPSTHCVLQEFCGIPTPALARALRCALLHAGQSKTTRQHIRTHLPRPHILSSSIHTTGAKTLGQGDRGSARDAPCNVNANLHRHAHPHP